MPDDDFEIAFACVFCGGEVNDDAPDSCELSVSAPSGVGQFTAHAGCFRAAAHDPENFPDLLTPATPPEDYEPPSEELQKAWDELEEALAEIYHADLDLGQTRAVVQELRKISEPFYAD